MNAPQAEKAPSAQAEGMSPEFTDTARAALLWVLWHHQGGSSPVGQPIRYALGMGQHDRLNEHQLSEAKRWETLHPVNPSVYPSGIAPQPPAISEGQPLFWVRLLKEGMYEGPVHNNSVGGKMLRNEKPSEWFPLYLKGQP